MSKHSMSELAEFSKVIAEAIRDQVKQAKDASDEQIRALAATIDEQRAEIKALRDELATRPANEPGEFQRAIDEGIARVRDEIEKAKPQDGRDGRDALELEILAAIDAEKSYPRGTFATHEGGLWRSFESTAGMKGWECIVNGTAEVAAELEDERTLRIVSRMADGTEKSVSVALPMLIDRGIYSAAREQPYAKGDGVTFNGSYWVAQQDAPEGQPGDDGAGWRMVVRKGRDRSGARGAGQ